MAGKQGQQPGSLHILTQEQEMLLDQYILHLDGYFEALKASEKLQVEIETHHLKKILGK